jgi:hypothetical protein
VSNFHFLPEPPDAPITVGAGEHSAPLEFDELTGGTQPLMYLRITKLGTSDYAPSGGNDPTLLLQAGTGPVTTVPLQTTVRIIDENHTHVADCRLHRRPQRCLPNRRVGADRRQQMDSADRQ